MTSGLSGSSSTTTTYDDTTYDEEAAGEAEEEEDQNATEAEADEEEVEAETAAAQAEAEAALAALHKIEAEQTALKETMKISLEAQRKLLEAFEKEKARIHLWCVWKAFIIGNFFPR